MTQPVVIRLYTLGELRLEPSFVPLSSRRKALALLGYLASHSGRSVRRPELAALLWGDREEDRARHSLRQALLELRQSLGENLRLDREWVTLLPTALEIDARLFQQDVSTGRMEAAVERWHGDYMAGADELGTDVFRAWLMGEQERLRRHLSTALGQLVTDAQQRGDWGKVVQWARSWTELLPLDERGHLHLIQALRLQGRPGDALAHHAAITMRLTTDLGRRPSAEFRRIGSVLEDAIREEQRVQRSEPEWPRQPEMVGRGDTFGRLTAAWSDIVAGKPAEILVEGDAGIGRTRLCEEFLRWAGSQTPTPLVLRGGSSTSAETSELGVAGDLLDDLATAPALGGTSPEALAKLSEILPALRSRFPNLPEAGSVAVSIVAALTEALGVVAEDAPLILFVDDFQNADDASRSLIRSLAQHLPGGVLLLLSSRFDTGDSSAADLRAMPGMKRLKLQPLTLPETTALLASMIDLGETDRHDLAVPIHVESGGNPLYVNELVTALVTEGHLLPGPDAHWRVNPSHAAAPLAFPASVRGDIRSRLLLPPPDVQRTTHRWPQYVGAALIILVVAVSISLTIRARDKRALDSRRVVVATFDNRTGNPALDRIGTIAADWITQGLVQTGLVEVADPVVTRGLAHAELARRTRAGILVSGSYYLQHDSLNFQARIVDEPGEEIVRGIRPILVPRAAPLIALPILSQRVMGSLATVVNPRLRSWAGAATQPPTFEAYEEYAQGLENFVREEWREAATHFDSAVRLDTTFHIAAIYAVRTHSALGENEAADSIGRALGRRGSQLLPYERALLDRTLKEMTPDLPARYRTAKAVAVLVPGSDEAVNAEAIDALQLNRPREAIRLFERIDPSKGFFKDWTYYWWALTSSYHLAGNYRGELDAARRGLEQYPDVMAIRANEVRALAALGRIDDLKNRLEATLTLPVSPAYYQGSVMTMAAVELRRHGYDRESQEVLALALAWYQARPLDNRHLRFEYAYALYLSGRYAEARRLFEVLMAGEPASGFYPTFVALTAARMGDRAKAKEILEWLQRTRPIEDFGESAMRGAQIAAVLGERDRAVQLIREALARGAGNTLQLHAEPDFASLRNYRPFREVTDPRG